MLIKINLFIANARYPWTDLPSAEDGAVKHYLYSYFQWAAYPKTCLKICWSCQCRQPSILLVSADCCSEWTRRHCCLPLVFQTSCWTISLYCYQLLCCFLYQCRTSKSCYCHYWIGPRFSRARSDCMRHRLRCIAQRCSAAGSSCWGLSIDLFGGFVNFGSWRTSPEWEWVLLDSAVANIWLVDYYWSYRLGRPLYYSNSNHYSIIRSKVFASRNSGCWYSRYGLYFEIKIGVGQCLILRVVYIGFAGCCCSL